MEFKKKLSFYTLKSYFIHFNIPFYNSPNILILILHIKTNTIHIFNLFFLFSYLTFFLSSSTSLPFSILIVKQPNNHSTNTNNTINPPTTKRNISINPLVHHHSQLSATITKLQIPTPPQDPPPSNTHYHQYPPSNTHHH